MQAYLEKPGASQKQHNKCLASSYAFSAQLKTCQGLACIRPPHTAAWAATTTQVGLDTGAGERLPIPGAEGCTGDGASLGILLCHL